MSRGDGDHDVGHGGAFVPSHERTVARIARGVASRGWVVVQWSYLQFRDRFRANTHLVGVNKLLVFTGLLQPGATALRVTRMTHSVRIVALPPVERA